MIADNIRNLNHLAYLIQIIIMNTIKGMFVCCSATTKEAELVINLNRKAKKL